MMLPFGKLSLPSYHLGLTFFLFISMLLIFFSGMLSEFSRFFFKLLSMMSFQNGDILI